MKPVRPAARLGVSLATLVTALTSVVLVPASADAAAWPGHPDRSIVRHVVRPGESATALAVRYHAWTAELLRLNHLGSAGTIRRGQVLRIPVVVSAVRSARGHAAPRRGWRRADLSRTQVRHLVARTARHYGVPRSLALAVAWQESGWQQRRVSSAGAIGVMQVMPDTGRWMRWYAGRPLRLRDTHDNVRAGVLTLKVLRSRTRHDTTAIAAYYQGLGAVREHGFFRDTRRYVRSVRALALRIERTGSPL